MLSLQIFWTCIVMTFDFDIYPFKVSETALFFWSVWYFVFGSYWKTPSLFITTLSKVRFLPTVLLKSLNKLLLSLCFVCYRFLGIIVAYFYSYWDPWLVSIAISPFMFVHLLSLRQVIGINFSCNVLTLGSFLACYVICSIFPSALKTVSAESLILLLIVLSSR